MTGCKSKKVRHESEEEAKKVLKKINRYREAVCRVYHCPDCGGYHLTSKRVDGGFKKEIRNKEFEKYLEKEPE